MGRPQDALAQAASLRSKADSLTAAADRDGQTIAQKDAALEAAKKAAEEEAAKFAAEADTLQAELNGEREGRAEDRQRLEEQIAKNMSKATKAEDRASKWRFFSGVAAVLSIIAAIVMMYIYSEYNSAVADAESYRTSLEVLRDTNVQLSAQIRALKAGGQPQAPAVAEEGEETTPAETRPASPPPAAPKSSEPTSFDEM